MNKHKTAHNRRGFLKKCSLSTLPFLLSPIGLQANKNTLHPDTAEAPVNFIYDGLALSPSQYLEQLQAINEVTPIQPDFYGNGGATQLLEEKFAKLTGKEKAIYLPTGTMANQLAIKLLNQNKTKAIVPENSHIYRDEADAAQSVHQKRLIPVGKGQAHFDLTELQKTLEYLEEGEVFRSGLGTVAIENPVRRADGAFVPLKTIKEISTYCQQEGYKMHLDGARIHLAAAYSGVSTMEYAAHFDTVYISLYKYLNATGGAMLCGDTELINQVAHQIKILGGTLFQNWNNTAVALHYLNGIEGR